MNGIKSEVKKYILDNILPQYKNYDQGHNEEHIINVMEDSLSIAKDYNVDMDMVYTIAAYHDIGLIHGREDHHLTSALYLDNDVQLREWFDNKKISIMKEAIEDHRASSNTDPRTIYGKIIADADREIKAERVFYRAMQYGKSHYPEYSLEEQCERAYDHISKKYGENGYLRFYLESEDNLIRLKELHLLIKDKNRFNETFSKFY